MKTLHFSTIIDAPRKAVWETMLAPETYKLWTAAFAEGSYYEGSWEKGGSIRFLVPSGEGMAAVIAENRLHEFLSIRHVGMVKDGVVDTESEEVRRWTPAHENYTFLDSGDATEVRVDIETVPDWESFMDEAWPKALATLKRICETGAS